MKNLQEFISAIPKYFDRILSANIFFITYNAVLGYENGVVSGTPDNIMIKIFSGGFLPDKVLLTQATVAYATGNDMAATDPLDEIQRESVDTLSKVKKELNSNVDTLHDAIQVYFIYAGLNAYDEAVEHTKEIKSSNPEAMIFILTCDCDLDKKSTSLNWAKEKGQIIDWTYTSECGGRGGMRDILNTVLKFFKDK